jgi:hypothetical protein
MQMIINLSSMYVKNVKHVNYLTTDRQINHSPNRKQPFTIVYNRLQLLVLMA